MQKIVTKHNRIRVIFTGAGTSAYVGDTVTPYVIEKVDEQRVGSTKYPDNYVSFKPLPIFQKDFPTLLVSFARSGNSPESVAAVQLAEQIVSDLYQITITCAKDGKLAKQAVNNDKNLLLLMPEKSNDHGFAMTGSYTCMALTALLVFDSISTEEKSKIVKEIHQMGESVIQREDAIQR
ncbi:SIS domain-containing protein [Bacillus cereus]